MLSKCANPGCTTSFLYLHEGKLFRIVPDENPNQPPPEAKKPARRVEFFWLCRKCAAKMTLTFEKGVGLKIEPLKSSPAMAS